MNLKQKAASFLRVEGLSAQELENLLTYTPDAKMGDVTLPCFKLAKTMHKAPQRIAEELKEQLTDNEWIAKAEAVNGYLNLFFHRAPVAAGVLNEVVTADGQYGSSREGTGKTICLDYSSVNIAKPFHIGHLGTTAIGSALYKIYEYLGYRVVGINHLGDWGTQFGKLIVAYKLWGDEETIRRGGVKALQEIYVRFHKEENEELDAQARQWFKRIEDGDAEAMRLFDWFKRITLEEVSKIYTRLKVKFDSYAGESFYNDKMQPVLDLLKQKGLLVESNGAEVVKLEDYGMPPCLLRKADGATLYATRDLAAAIYRKETYDFDKCLYVVAYQQNLHFQQVFQVLKLAGFPWADDLVHVAYGMVSLEEGSMSTRAGNVVWLTDVLEKAVEKAKDIIEQKSPNLPDKAAVAEQIGVGAVLFSALQNGRMKDIVFTFDRVLNFDGETCPYLQYTHARCRSVLNKGGKIGRIDFSALTDDDSMAVVRLLNAFPATVREAADKYEPSCISKYLIDLAQAYNKFYIEHRILTEDAPTQNARLLLTQCTASVLKTGLSLLGIDAPEQM